MFLPQEYMPKARFDNPAPLDGDAQGGRMTAMTPVLDSELVIH